MRALAVRLRGIAVSFPGDLLLGAAADLQAAAVLLLTTGQGSNDATVITAAQALQCRASTLVAAVARLGEAEKWIEWYCAALLGITGAKRPDHLIEGKIFGCLAPTTNSARNIAKRMAEKVEENQADGIVLDLRDSPVDRQARKAQLTDWPVPGLREVIVIDKNATVKPFHP